MFAAGGVSSSIGRAFLLVGIIGSLFGALASISSARSRDRTVARLIPRFAILIFAAAVGAFATMEYAMITRDFSMAYVQKVGSTATPALYNFAAVWSALEGSLLMWVLILAGYTVAVCFWLRKKNGRRVGQLGNGSDVYCLNVFLFAVVRSSKSVCCRCTRSI